MPTRVATDPEARHLRALLTRPLPEVPPRYLYDDAGCALFERITRLDVYYPTRTEVALLERHAGELLAAARPRHLVELGSGSDRKLRPVLDAWRPRPPGATCTLVDINPAAVEEAARRLAAEHPDLEVRGVAADFSADLRPLVGPGGRRLTLFLGSTLGNLYPAEQRAFFARLSRSMTRDDALLVGVDLIKDRATLEAAYDDPEGVTAAFDRNALAAVNRRFGGDFDLRAFNHRAFYDPHNEWVEMRLVARRPMRVRLEGLDLTLDLAEGAELRTEVSCKFTRESLAARAVGLTIDRWVTDPGGLFALALLRRPAAE